MHHQVKLDSFVHSLNGFFLLDSSGVLRILSKLSRRHAILLDPSQIGCMHTYTKYLKLTNSDLSLMLLHDCRGLQHNHGDEPASAVDATRFGSLSLPRY